ncbi:MAG: HyaD/HybD family hydrogenase maturation endopeptidase [Schwartzia sp.]|nr:HyaD/HybD family hydrogenase maturation endopeptidase [Schwartzia sp. (in: firmicutes)]
MNDNRNDMPELALGTKVLREEYVNGAAKPVVVLGIGNILLCDEGFGVRVVEYLSERGGLPDNVELVDGGTLGPELLHFVTGAGRLIIVDAVKGAEEDEPGKLYRFAGEAVNEHFSQGVMAHELGITDLLALMRLIGQAVPEVVVLGAVPYDLSPSLDMTEEMAKLVPVMADMVKEAAVS